MKELLCSSLAILQCILHNPERVLLKISICFFILCSEFCIHLNFTLSKMWDLSINEGVKGLILVLRILQLIFPFIYIPSLPASLLWCDLPSPRQRLRTLPLYFCQKLGLELSSGPARPLRAGSAAFRRKLCTCSQLCREEPGSFLCKGDQNNGIFEFYSGPTSSPNWYEYGWILSQQDGVGRMLLECHLVWVECQF